MKFNWFSCSSRLSLKEAWDEVDSNTEKLVCLKYGNVYPYETKARAYYVSNYKKDLVCDKGILTADTLVPVFLTAPRSISKDDIVAISKYLYDSSSHVLCGTFGLLASLVSLLDRNPGLVPTVKKETPEIFAAIKQCMENFKEIEIRTGSRYSNLFRQIFSLDMWPVHDPKGYTPLETMKANYLWYKTLGKNNVAAEYATKYVAVKAMEDSLSDDSK